MDKSRVIVVETVPLCVFLVALLIGCTNRWTHIQAPTPATVHANNSDAVRHVPSQAIRDYLLGQIYWADGEYELAQGAFARALLHDPQSPWIVGELEAMLAEWETAPMEEGSSGVEQVTPSMIK